MIVEELLDPLPPLEDELTAEDVATEEELTEEEDLATEDELLTDEELVVDDEDEEAHAPTKVQPEFEVGGDTSSIPQYV